jgi:hypothetical protein
VTAPLLRFLRGHPLGSLSKNNVRPRSGGHKLIGFEHRMKVAGTGVDRDCLGQLMEMLESAQWRPERKLAVPRDWVVCQALLFVSTRAVRVFVPGIVSELASG